MDRHEEHNNRETSESEVLIPELQETIIFKDQPIIGVRLPNGESGIVLRSICNNLQLDLKGQVQRIRRTEVIASDLVYVRVQTEGGPQVLATLILSSVPYWLATIDTHRLDKTNPRRQDILDYQLKAADVLYTWAKSIKEVPPSSIVPEKQIVKPVAPPDGASLDEWQEFHRQMVIWIEWQRDMQAWQGNVESRLDSLEAVTGRILKQIGPPRITIEHQILVQYYVSRLHKATGKDQQTIYAALKTAFGVPRYDEIPESEWGKVEQWFKRQLPDQQFPPTQEKLF